MEPLTTAGLQEKVRVFGDPGRGARQPDDAVIIVSDGNTGTPPTILLRII